MSNHCGVNLRTDGEAHTQYFYYDASGNRTKKTLGGTDTTYLYNTADQLTSETTSGTTTTYEYDANGALTKSDDGTTVNAYTYDYEGYQMAFDTTGTDNDATYTYDAGKRRIAKVVNSVTTKYFLDGANVIADFDGDNVLQATYVSPGLDNNVSLATGGSTYYYMKDGLGSIRNVVDSNEATQNTYDYYAFGKELGSWTENVTNRYTYTAREYDSESEQYYYRARYYTAAGRFSRRDPLLPHGYIYVGNCPAAKIDPTGLKVAWVFVEYRTTKGPTLFTNTAVANAKAVFAGCWATLTTDQVAFKLVKRSLKTWGFLGWGKISKNCWHLGIHEDYTGPAGLGQAGKWTAGLHYVKIHKEYGSDTRYNLDVMVGNYIAHEVGFEMLAGLTGGVAAGGLFVENSPLTIPLHWTVGTFMPRTCTRMKRKLGVK